MSGIYNRFVLNKLVFGPVGERPSRGKKNCRSLFRELAPGFLTLIF